MNAGLLDIETRVLSDTRVTPISGLTRHQIWRHSLPHALSQPSVLWITRGNARMILAGRAMGLGPNVALVIPAGTPFAIEPGSQMQASLLSLPDHPLVPLPDRFKLLRLQDIPTQAELSGLIDRISSALQNPGVGQARCLAARCMLVSALIERLAAAQADHTRPSAALRLAERFAREVEALYATDATLSDIGARLNVSPTHLTRTMKATCAVTAAQYLNDRVMHAARSALVDKPESAAAIARRLGFSSPAYFSRAFTQHTGTTPGAFRDQHKKKPAQTPRFERHTPQAPL